MYCVLVGSSCSLGLAIVTGGSNPVTIKCSPVDFIAPIISNCIQDNIDKPVKDIGEALYNVAVELTVLNNLIAFCYDIDKDNIDDVYELCKREVAKTNGLFDFRQAHRLQNQAQYNEWQK